jgi:hypothetical protein
LETAADSATGIDRDRYELAKGTNMVDYTEQLYEQVKGMEGVTPPSQGR